MLIQQQWYTQNKEINLLSLHFFQDIIHEAAAVL